jgi:hypothetical protein
MKGNKQMNTITTSSGLATSNPIEQARQQILSAQKMIAANEGRILDFETADEISRCLLSSIQSLTPPIVSIFEEEDTLTDDEAFELEMLLSRDHDDASCWKQGGARQ